MTVLAATRWFLLVLCLAAVSSGCARFGGDNDELEPLPPELQNRVIATSTATSGERSVERGLAPAAGQLSSDPQTGDIPAAAATP